MDKRSACIVAFNALLFVLGVVVLGLSIAMSVMFQQGGWTAVISSKAVGLSVFAGVLMILVSLMGCFSAKRKNRRVLCVNLLCVGALFIILCVASALLLRYAAVAQNQVDLLSSELVDEDDRFMNNALASVYNKCCSGCNDADIALFTGSLAYSCNMMSDVPAGDDFVRDNNGWTGNRCNTTLQAIEYPGYPTVLCENPGPCFAVESTVDNCWLYDRSDNSSWDRFPPYYVDLGFCNTLKGIRVNGDPIVGFPQSGGCGRGTMRVFVDSMKLYFAPIMYSSGVVFACFAVLIVVVLLVGAHVVATTRKVNTQATECTPATAI